METDKPPPECERLRFIVERDGFAEALSFAQRTAKLYRQAVIQRRGLCSTKAGRIGFIKSYKAFKVFISQCEGMDKTEEFYRNASTCC